MTDEKTKEARLRLEMDKLSQVDLGFFSFMRALAKSEGRLDDYEKSTSFIINQLKDQQP